MIDLLMEEQKKKILDFIKTQILGVVSTVDANNNPESAVVAFSETDNLELIFGSFSDTRKNKNLQNNNRVSFVISDNNITVQYEGLAKELSGSEAIKAREIHLFKNPSSKKYAFDEKQRFFKVTPTWIRYSDFNYNPKKVFEIKF